MEFKKKKKDERKGTVLGLELTHWTPTDREGLHPTSNVTFFVCPLAAGHIRSAYSLDTEDTKSRLDGMI